MLYKCFVFAGLHKKSWTRYPEMKVSQYWTQQIKGPGSVDPLNSIANNEKYLFKPDIKFIMRSATLSWATKSLYNQWWIQLYIQTIFFNIHYSCYACIRRFELADTCPTSRANKYINKWTGFVIHNFPMFVLSPPPPLYLTINLDDRCAWFGIRILSK